MGNPAQTNQEALCGCPISLAPCPCCGLADAVAEEYDICPRCSWEHCSGDETSPWLGSAFSGPNHMDMGHYRLDLWRWLLHPEGEPCRMSLIGLDQDGRDELEAALCGILEAQPLRPRVPSVNLTEAEVLDLFVGLMAGPGFGKHVELSLEPRLGAAETRLETADTRFHDTRADRWFLDLRHLVLSASITEHR